MRALRSEARKVGGAGLIAPTTFLGCTQRKVEAQMIENILVGVLVTGLAGVFVLGLLVIGLCVLGAVEARTPGDN